MLQPEAYWTYKASPTPELHDLPKGAFVGTEAGFNSLPPGMRREIYRSAMKRQAAADAVLAADAERLARANTIHHQAEVQIAAREAL